MRRIAVLAACLLASPASAAPFSSFSMPATCRISQIVDGVPHRHALWKGTADGTPSVFIQYGKYSVTRYEWSPRHETAGGAEYRIRVTVTDGTTTGHRFGVQSLDASGLFVDDGIGFATWTYDAGTLVGFADYFGSYEWTYDAAGRLWSLTSNEGFGDETETWTWDDDNRLVSYSSVNGDSSYSDDWDEWNDMGLPTSGTQSIVMGSERTSGAEAVEWDDQGRVTRWETPDATKTYTWTDAPNGAVRVETSDDERYAWDADGRLLEWYWRGDHWWYSWDADGTLRAVRSAYKHSEGGGYVFTGVCPEAAWASYVREVRPLGPLHELPTPPRPFGW